MAVAISGTTGPIKTANGDMWAGTLPRVTLNGNVVLVIQGAFSINSIGGNSVAIAFSDTTTGTWNPTKQSLAITGTPSGSLQSSSVTNATYPLIDGAGNAWEVIPGMIYRNSALVRVVNDAVWLSYAIANGVGVVTAHIYDGSSSTWNGSSFSPSTQGSGTPPSVPQSVMASNVAPTSATISWTAPATGSGPFTYTVQYQLAASPNTPFTSIPVGTALSTSLTSLVASTQYNIQVFATNLAAPTGGPASAAIQLTTLAAPATTPDAPTGITVAQIADTIALISFTPATTGVPATSFKAQWSVHNAASWTDGATVTLNTSQITGLTASTSYDFRVVPINGAGSGTASGLVTASTTATPTASAWNPSGASGTIAFSNSNKTVTAGGSTTPYAAEQNAFATVSFSTGKRWFDFVLTTLSQDVTIGLANSSYVVGTGGNLGIDANAIGYYPATGAGAQPAQSAFFNGAAVLTPVGTPAQDSGGATGTCCFDVDRGLVWFTTPSVVTTYGTGAWNDAAPTASDAGTGIGGIPIGVIGTLFPIYGASEGGSVVTINGGATGSAYAPWNFVSISGKLETIVIPGTPQSLTAASVTSTSVTLTWADPSTGTHPYGWILQISPHGAGSWTTVTPFNFRTTSGTFTVTGLTPSTQYDFRLSAGNPVGTSSNTGTVSGTTSAAVSPPGQVVGVATSNPTASSVVVSWPVPSGAAPTSYQVLYRLASGTTYSPFLPPVTAPTTSQTITGLAAATAYSFEVQAINSGGSGTVSAAVNGTTASGSTGPGPTATGGTLANIDFANPTSPGGINNAIVDARLFGISTGGTGNSSFSVLTGGQAATFIRLVRALNLPLFRLNSVSYTPASLNILAVNMPALVPSTCTVIVGIQSTPLNTVAATALSAWNANSSIPVAFWECLNESGLPASTYNADFALMMTGLTGQKGAGNVNAGVDPAGLQSLIASSSATLLGLLDNHQYLYCRGVDTTPSDAQACLAQTASGTALFPVLVQNVQNGVSGFGKTLPFFMGEFNIECSASGLDLRAGTSIGAAFLVSSTLGMAAVSTQPIYTGIWDLFNDAGAAYQLIDTSMNVYPQYYTLQRLIAKMPGTMVNSTSAKSGGAAWATQSAGNFGVAVVNSTGTTQTGTVALSHWPVNGTGNGSATVWTYPTGSNSVPVANTPGTTSTVTVTSGVTDVISVPARSTVIISSTP